MLSFARHVAPQPQEQKLRDAALARIKAACADLHWYEVEPFGSKASGLELWNSDVDMVVLGLMEPNQGGLGEYNSTWSQFLVAHVQQRCTLLILRILHRPL